MEGKKDRYAGIVLTVAVHGLLLTLGFSAGISRMQTPPPVDGMLIEFPEESRPVPIRTETGVEPRAAEVSPSGEVRLVQKSEAPVMAEAENRGPGTSVGDEGDVEVPEPPQEKPIDRRALFSSRRNSPDTASAQVADRISDRLEAGHVHGNTAEGNPEGHPTARLEGRSVMGNLPLPEYSVAKSGTVVVRILVDQYGNVTGAYPGAKGTTVQDATLWEAAKKAALEAKFNLSESAPPVQEGTISYVFTLK